MLFETHGGAVPMACSIWIERDFIRPSGRRWKILECLGNLLWSVLAPCSVPYVLKYLTWWL